MDAFGPDHIRVKCTYQQHAKSHQIFIASPQIDFDVEWVDCDMSLLNGGGKWHCNVFAVRMVPV